MNHIKKCFLLSARALSLEWCERDLVNSISSFSSSSAPRLLMYSEPLSEGPFSIGVQVAGWVKNRRVGVLNLVAQPPDYIEWIKSTAAHSALAPPNDDFRRGNL